MNKNKTRKKHKFTTVTALLIKVEIILLILVVIGALIYTCHSLYISNTQWKQQGTKVTKGKVTLTVGQKIENYNELIKEDGTKVENAEELTDVEWRVLGAEKGKLLIVSATNVKRRVDLNGKEGYNNGTEVLNQICSKYGQGKYADGARSITVEDINKITGYNPKETGDGRPYGYSGEDNGRQYNSKVTYTNLGFEHPDGRVIDGKNIQSIDIISSGYQYYPETLSKLNPKIGVIVKGICNNPSNLYDSYDALFSNTDFKRGAYWLASKYEVSMDGMAYFGLRSVEDGRVKFFNLAFADGSERSGRSYGARAVVYLNSDVEVSTEGVIS